MLYPKYRDIHLYVIGLIFLGTPFRGTGMAKLGEWVAQICGRNKKLLKSLETHCDILDETRCDFLGAYDKLNMTCIYETIGQRFGLWKEIASLNHPSFNGLLLTETDCR